MFISNVKQLKLNHLYSLKDTNENEFIIHIVEISDMIYFYIVSNRDGITGSSTADQDHLNLDYISNVKETSEDFDRGQYAFYEIGLKEDHPEYFL